MRAIVCAAALACAPMPALAQYAGPGVETCRGHAEREIRKESAAVTAIAFDRDQHLNIERYTRKIGSQFVSSLLFGNGAIVYAKAPAVEMSFLCLLADEKRAVFFHWTPRRDAPVLAQCRRGAGDAGGCLDTLLQVAEQDLTQAYAQRLQEARELDAARKSEDSITAFRKTADVWRAYRDAECARRGAGDERKACMIELTRRRALDLR